MDLINLLVTNLGVSEDQAKGGAGLLFKLAQDKLGGGDFAQVTESVSGIDDMIAAAPGTESGGVMGAIGGLMSAVGGDAGKLAGLASLGGGFEKLGLDTGMISKFVPLVLDFVRNRGGEGVSQILKRVFSAS